MPTLDPLGQEVLGLLDDGRGNDARPPHLANGTRVHVRSHNCAEECDAGITKEVAL